MKAILVLLSAGMLLIPGAPPATSQEYPTKPIMLVAPLGVGGLNDVFARLLAPHLEPILGVPVVVENRPGAGGRTGARFVAAAKPDGYTLLIGNTAILANIPAFSKNVGYDPIKDFVPIAKLTEIASALLVRSDFEAKTLDDLIAFAKRHPNQLNFSSAGTGNFTHLIGELLKLRTGTEMVHVPYRSAHEAINAILSGDAHLNFSGVGFAMNQIKAGKLRALAVSGYDRDPDLPDVPTLSETLPGFVALSFFGIIAPANTPDPIVSKLNAAINKALEEPELAARFKKMGLVAHLTSPSEFSKFIADQLALWEGIAKKTKIMVD